MEGTVSNTYGLEEFADHQLWTAAESWMVRTGRAPLTRIGDCQYKKIVTIVE
jgi:hypothetical protein